MLAEHGRKSGTNLVYARLAAPRLLPAVAPQRATVSPSFAPRTLPPRIYCFRFGPAYPISKLLNLFKLSSQHLNTKT